MYKQPDITVNTYAKVGCEIMLLRLSKRTHYEQRRGWDMSFN